MLYSITIYEGTNDLNLKIKIIDTLPARKIAFSSIVLRKDWQNINELRIDFNAKLWNFWKQKNVVFIDSRNSNESHLGMKKLHLNRKGNSVLDKN